MLQRTDVGSTAESRLAPGQEWELKFQVAREQLPELPRALAAMGLTTGAPETEHLVATYYDTSAFDLRGRGAMLRVRREGERLVQCVKASGSPGQSCAMRREWETEVPTSSPDPSLVPEAALACLGSGIDWDGLRPVFRVDVERTAWLITFDDGNAVELCVDVGEIATESSSCPVCEYELELKAGQPLRLLNLAQGIVHAVPARLDPRTKSDRGYGLAGKGGGDWHKAKPVQLSCAQTAEEALVHVMRSGLRQLRLNEECVLARTHPEGVHQMRVAVRRMRSALSIYRKLLPPSDYGELSAGLKWLLRALGPSRDWDVFVEQTLGVVVGARPGDPALVLMRERSDEERTAAYQAAQEAIRSQRYTLLLLRLEAWLLARGWREQKVSVHSARLFAPVASLAAGVLAQRAKRVRRAGQHFGSLTAEELHQLRIHVKKLRYASEFFRSLWPKARAKRYIATLEDLQDTLGRLNDLSVAQDLISRLVHGVDTEQGARLSLARGMVVGWHARGGGSTGGAKAWRAFQDREPFWDRP